MNSTTNTLIHSTPISDMSNSYSSCNVLLATETKKDIKFRVTKLSEQNILAQSQNLMYM